MIPVSYLLTQGYMTYKMLGISEKGPPASASLSAGMKDMHHYYPAGVMNLKREEGIFVCNYICVAS